MRIQRYLVRSARNSIRHASHAIASLALCVSAALQTFAHAQDKVLEISPRGTNWVFSDPGNRYLVESNIERHYDLPFAGKEVVFWVGRGISDQTVTYELPSGMRDFSGYNTIKLWVKFDLIGSESRKWEQLFVPGNDDGNMHVILFDEAGKSSAAYIQCPDKFHVIGTWQEVTLSLKKDFGSYASLDVRKIKAVGIGFNVLNDEGNASLPYTFSFAGLHATAKEQAMKSQSKIFPGQYMPYNRAYILQDYPTWLHVAMAAGKETVKALPEQYVFEIEIPSRMLFKGVNGYLTGWSKILPKTPLNYWGSATQMEDWQDRELDISSKPLTRDGEDYIRYSIPLRRAEAETNLRDTLDGGFTSGLDVFVSNQEGARRNGNLYWRCEAIGLDWQSVAYEVMPELPKGPSPKRLKTLVFSGGELGYEGVWKEAISLFKTAGFNSYASGGWISPRIKRWLEILKSQGINVDIGGQTGIYASTYSTKKGDRSLWEYFDGKRNTLGIACLTYCAQNGDKYAEAAYPFYQHANEYYAPSGLVMDFEMNDVLTLGYDCPRCQQAFKEHLGVTVTEWNGKVIRDKYNEQFKTFRLGQIAQMVKTWVAVIREKSPTAKVILCSGHVPFGAESAKRHIEHSGSDPRLWDAEVDEHWPMIYYNGATCFRDIQETVDVLHKPVVPLLGSGWGVGVNQFTPTQCELNALACLLAGADGYGYFVGFVSWDAMYWDKITRVSHLAAEIEDMVLDGADVTKDVRIDGALPGGDCVAKVYQLKGEVLIGAINYSGKSTNLEVTLIDNMPDAAVVLYDNQDRSKNVMTKSGRVIKLNLNPQEAAFVRLSQQVTSVK